MKCMLRQGFDFHPFLRYLVHRWFTFQHNDINGSYEMRSMHPTILSSAMGK